ncbi:MAG: hypothetical protein H6512_11360 [Acidimicrobiia bacterium]|nr:hypothetical protein [Acidimicrobiia bacterium]
MSASSGVWAAEFADAVRCLGAISGDEVAVAMGGTLNPFVDDVDIARRARRRAM